VYSGISRAQFERLLTLRLDRLRLGTAQKVKRLLGRAWRKIVDEMYERNAKRLAENQFAAVITECADAINSLSKSVKAE
jgi:predicted kinase